MEAFAKQLMLERNKEAMSLTILNAILPYQGHQNHHHKLALELISQKFCTLSFWIARY